MEGGEKMKINFNSCWQCGKKIWPHGEFVLLAVDAEGSFITPEVINERGTYHAAHVQCETDVMEAILRAKTPGDEDTL